MDLPQYNYPHVLIHLENKIQTSQKELKSLQRIQSHSIPIL
jgi:hypothetical protein